MERIEDFEEPITVPLGTYYSKRQMWMVFVCGMIVGVILSIILVLIEPK
jgi:hypothetical protein